MKQREFELRCETEWQELAGLLERLEARQGRRRTGADAGSRLPVLYRRVCNHYAIACQRGYSPNLQANLHNLVLRSHRQLYAPVVVWLAPVLKFIRAGFPRAVRAQRRLVFVAGVLFVVPALAVGWFCYRSADMIYSITAPDNVAVYEEMYDPDSDHVWRTEERRSESRFRMFGFYIMNNVSIGFRTFASGLLLGIGPVVLLLFNGISIGGIAGHLTGIGYTATFWPFVAGHSAAELTAIVLCGAAGLLLGAAIFAPGRLSRSHALRRNAGDAVPIVCGSALMLLGAAFIEAFFSSAMSLPVALKFTVGAIGWTSVIVYFVFAGRSPDGSR